MAVTVDSIASLRRTLRFHNQDSAHGEVQDGIKQMHLKSDCLNMCPLPPVGTLVRFFKGSAEWHGKATLSVVPGGCYLKTAEELGIVPVVLVLWVCTKVPERF